MTIIQKTELSGKSINYNNITHVLLNNYPDAVWIRDSKNKLLFANGSYYKYFKSINENVSLIKQKRDGNKLVVHVNNGEVLLVTVLPVILKTEKCNLYVSQNITEQEKIKERFFVNKYQLDALLENIPKIIYMKDLEGNYITGTKYSKEFFNNRYDTFNGVKLEISGEDVSKNYEDKSVIENNSLLNYERQFFDLNGIPHWYTIYKAPINNYQKEVIGILVMIQNIDGEKHIQAQRETFVASLGHDLKNPTLAQIRAVELLLKGSFGQVTGEQREILSMLLDSCRYMNAMLGSLLATYRNEGGAVKLNYEQLSLPDLTKDCIEEMVYIAKDKGIDIKIKNESTIPTIYADKVQIKRVIMNLLSNGIKYAYKNTSITIKIYNEINLTCFRLENYSPYIPPEKQDMIFARYVSFASAHKELGIGLGLYASKKIVNALAGDIFVESFEDERTVFGFKIPNIENSICASKTVSF